MAGGGGHSRAALSCRHGVGTEELRQHAEQHVVLARHVDRVAGRVGLVPIGAELRLPVGQHRHPVRDLRLRRPGDVLRQIWRLFLAESFERQRRGSRPWQRIRP